MSTRKEGAGLRAPPRHSVRAKILAVFTENPGYKLSRQEALERFGVSNNSADMAISALKKQGCIKSARGPGGTSYYELVTLVGVKVPRPPRKPAPKRAWPESRYVEPKPIANSIFEYAKTL